MTNHSLISASGGTHAKTAFLALAASLVFIAVVSASGVTIPMRAPPVRWSRRPRP